MFKMNKLGVALAVVALTTSASSFADHGNDYYGNNDSYEIQRRLDRLENRVRELERRVENLSQPVSVPIQDAIHVCSVTDSGYGKSYLGIGHSKLDAEYQARNACQTNTAIPSFCDASNATASCDDNSQSYGRNYFCIVTDSGYGKTYRGEGRTRIEAEVKARQSCQGSTAIPSFCSPGNAQASCDSSR